MRSSSVVIRCTGFAFAIVFATDVLAATATRLEFNRDIRPILSENCFSCHGQDPSHREAKLRLDERESAIRNRDGYAVIAPGKPDESELILRITSKDDDEVMPPRDSNKHLTPEQIALLRQWITEGADYQKHWAFISPRRPALPSVRASAWPRQPIDRFIFARLEREGLPPSPAAPPATWLRRASLDLTGLPPTPQELDAFTADAAKRGEAAFAAAADRLLASAHYGERLAVDWLDAARYADTHGFNNDSARVMWRWRDWVIDAFNANMPYNQFITEQLAGDLLPKPTVEQRLATAFGRNHVINSEGGIIEEEYRVEYVADRVRTTSTAWLGLTMECSRCHDHKFDPIAQRDYYRFFAFFNNVPEHGEDGRSDNAVPMMPAPTREQQATLAAQTRALSDLEKKLEATGALWRWNPSDKSRVESLASLAASALAAEIAKDNQAPAPPAKPAPAAPVADADGEAPEPDSSLQKIPAVKINYSAKTGLTVGLWLRADAGNPADAPIFSSCNHLASPAGTAYGQGAELRLIDGELEFRIADRLPMYSVTVRTEGAKIRPGDWRHIALTYTGGKKAAHVRFYVDGVLVPFRVLYDDLFNAAPRGAFLVGADNGKGTPRWRGKIDDFQSFPRVLGADSVRTLFQAQALPRAISNLEQNVATDIERGWLRDALLADTNETRELCAQVTDARIRHLEFRLSLPTAMVMTELPQRRPTFVLKRGLYDAPGDPVEPGVPEALLVRWPKDAPRNRLGLAQWFTRSDHPLTARVVVNRFWAQLFGTGLVKTFEDFGSQGEWPSHPELLDWLAREFVDGGWNVKALLKTLVLSSTYRQSSAVTPALVTRDPENRLLARGPRVRLSAELIRDQALAVSGLLSRRIGGPSVFPYQPAKLYEGIVVGAAYPGTEWKESTGEDLYRRSLYTFWKRTVPHPAMTTFDAPDREFCTVRRSRTNTPLQALALWNEPGQLEAARQLGVRMWREGGRDDAARVAFAFQSATGRRPTAEEARLLGASLSRLRTDFAAHPDDAAALLKTGASPVDTSIPTVELAAASALANIVLNLDETISNH